MPTRVVRKPRTAEERKQRIRKILAILDRTWPNATTELKYRDAWELLVATILSAQCTDKRVNEVTPGCSRSIPRFTISPPPTRLNWPGTYGLLVSTTTRPRP
jgi:hypothetical protein